MGKRNFSRFPPFAMILLTLQKIANSRASGVIIVPFWPTHPSYPLFLSLLTQVPIIFEPSMNLLLSPCRQKIILSLTKCLSRAGNSQINFLKQRIKEDMADIIVDSIRTSTIKQYSICLTRWMNFTETFNPKNLETINFLTLRFNGGASYGSLNSPRSTIYLITHSKFSKNPLISRSFRGFYEKRPMKPKYDTT